jgi:hypothetical protein
VNRAGAVFVLVLPWSLRGQGAAPPPRAPFNAELICAQTDSQHIARVQFEPPATGGTLGPVLSCNQNGLTLGAFAGQDQQTIAPASMQRLWVRRGSGVAGAVWGGVVGGLLGYAIFSARTRQCTAASSNSLNANHCTGNIPVGIALGIVSGVGIGWFFGKGIPRWKSIYQAGP